MTYEEQKKEAEELIKKEKLDHIVAGIKERIEKIEQFEEDVLRLKREVNDLTLEGELKNIEDYIKISAKTSSNQATALSINI